MYNITRENFTPTNRADIAGGIERLITIWEQSDIYHARFLLAQHTIVNEEDGTFVQERWRVFMATRTGEAFIIDEDEFPDDDMPNSRMIRSHSMLLEPQELKMLLEATED